jgi:hypothetical protein
VLVTHTPPYRHCDESVSKRKAMGCEVLRRVMWRVRPRVHVCGHVHEARGVKRVAWDLDGGRGNVGFKEEKVGVEGWRDEGTGGKMSLVDLTGRRGTALDNDGGHPCQEVVEGVDKGAGRDEKMVEDGEEEGDGIRDDHCYGLCLSKASTDHGPETATQPQTPIHSDHPAASPGEGTIGLGLSPDTDRSPARSDMAALKGRMGRRETCVVNCAITATNWPHAGGRRFNKPIVVDLDLPVWAWGIEQEDEAFGFIARYQ